MTARPLPSAFAVALLLALAGCATPAAEHDHGAPGSDATTGGAKAMDCKPMMARMHAAHHGASAPAAGASAPAMQCPMMKKG